MRLCTQPFKGAIKPPRHEKWDPKEQAKKPDVETNLEYVFGYRAKDMRNNIKYLPNGNIVYNAAALGIVYDIKANEQRYFKEHRDDITALSVSQDTTLAATGETGAKPRIFVWSTNTLEVKNKFQGFLQKGIALISFTPSGNKLVASAMDDNHCIALYDLTNKQSVGGCLISDTQGGRDIMTELQMKNENQFVTVGPKHFKVWTQKGEGKKQDLVPQKGRWGKNQCSDKLTTVSINFGNQDIVCGAMDGTVQIFKDTTLNNFKKLHSRSVQSITVQHGFVFTGGNDCKINVLSGSTYETVLIIDEKTFEGSLCPKIRSINMHPNKRQLVVGTYACEIFQLTTKDNQLRNNTVFIPKQIMAGHYTPNQQAFNEVWGLAVFPNNKDFYATCSDDGTLRIWSVSEKKMLKQVSINQDENGNQLPPEKESKDIQNKGKGRAIGISPDGNFIVVGHHDGTIRVLNKSLKVVKIFKDSTESISDIKFSPDGTVLAVGSHDNAIYCYKLPNFKQKFKPLAKHSSYITHFDFSEDGQTLHSTCGAYELLFWDMVKGKQQTSGATMNRDEKWNSWTVPIGYQVQGIFRKGYDGTDINAVDRSNFPVGNKAPQNYHLLATGDDYSRVNVFKYPSIQKGSKCITNRGHSSHVTNVKFTKDDKRIISTGGEDQCVMQWKVTKNLPPINNRKNSLTRVNTQQGPRVNTGIKRRNSQQSLYYKH
ncbi:WD40-repeat-containing domain [Pseudocohnilembus persalinus]|uniref:WD40-repeat-containing domain n=1 Tax=Pseudocohnilembus persalinus TaxID=266149 RepID=A0A0V0Q7Y1_PSEPJ|nr:WD40-repeat-containing domain [Pseudocohnilembus persalinus]|eukprot:KRW98348.1 WD40-repeat-containing domain [Pseudocohnilembus persalinus]